MCMCAGSLGAWEVGVEGWDDDEACAFCTYGPWVCRGRGV